MKTNTTVLPLQFLLIFNSLTDRRRDIDNTDHMVKSDTAGYPLASLFDMVSVQPMLRFSGNPNHYLRSNIRNDMRKSDTTLLFILTRTHASCRSFTFGFRPARSPFLPPSRSIYGMCVRVLKERAQDGFVILKPNQLQYHVS